MNVLLVRACVCGGMGIARDMGSNKVGEGMIATRSTVLIHASPVSTITRGQV